MDLSLGLPPENADYKDQFYWNNRFEQEDSYEWLANYDEIKVILRSILDRFGTKARILQLGCGTSSLPIDLYNNGFKDITNIDFSEVCIKKMSSKFPQLKFVQMDMTNMISLGEDTFDVVLEKATLDSLLVDTISPWDLCSPGCKKVTKVLKEVKKVLRKNGVFVSITFSQPHFRVPLLAQEGLQWSLQVEKFSTTGGVLDYYVYQCEEGDPSVAVSKWCLGNGPVIETKDTWTSSDEEQFITKLDSSCLGSSSEEEEGSGG